MESYEAAAPEPTKPMQAFSWGPRRENDLPIVRLDDDDFAIHGDGTKHLGAIRSRPVDRDKLDPLRVSEADGLPKRVGAEASSASHVSVDRA